MPDWQNAIRARLKQLNLQGGRESEIIDELSDHLDDCYRELLAAGKPPAEALRLAMLELDTHDLLAAGLRKTRQPRALESASVGSQRGRNLMDGIHHDLRVALRMIRSKPGFSFAVMGMLALGVAGNAAIFSIFNGLFLRPLPFADPARLVDLDETAPKWNLEFVGVSNPDFAAWQKENTTFDGMAFFGGGGANVVTADGAAQRIRSSDVTYNLLDVLGLKPAAGRNFLPEEDRPGGARVVMLGYDLWQRLYHGDPNAVGQILKADDQPYTIVGILPREAILPDVEAWRPLAADPAQHTGWYLNGVGRLKRGVTPDQARADLLRVHRAMFQSGKNANDVTSPVLGPLRNRYLGDFQKAARILLGAVGVVLLIACVNIAG